MTNDSAALYVSDTGYTLDDEGPRHIRRPSEEVLSRAQLLGLPVAALVEAAPALLE